MDTQAAPALDLWLCARNAAQLVVSYPYFYLFPTLTIARHSIVANPARAERLSAETPSPNFFAAFFFPFKPFCVWVVEQLLRDFLNTLLSPYLGKTIIIGLLCAPLKLMRTWAIVRGHHTSLRSLIRSARSLGPDPWLYYVGTLLVCEVVEFLLISPFFLPLYETAQDLQAMQRQNHEAPPQAGLTWIFTFIAQILGTAGIAVLLEWFPSNIVSVRAALSLLDPGYGGGRGFWTDIKVSLKSINTSLCGKLALYYCLGIIATAGTRFLLLAINSASNLVIFLSKLEPEE